MAQQTEAACLLETGALYATRVLLFPGGGDPIFAGFKAGAFSLYFGDAPIYHFDLEGRWQRAFIGGTHFLKALDTTVQAIDRVREGENLVLKRRTLDETEAAALDERVRETARDLVDSLDAGTLERADPPPKARPLEEGTLRAFLERVGGWDAAAWSSHHRKYRGVYGPLPFLPPDCPNALVLQATLGQAGGIGFGQGPTSEHRVRTPVEFAEHLRSVASLIGRRVAQCRAVFLGGSDVLRRPPGDVAAYLEEIGRVFPVDRPPGPRSSRDATEDGGALEGVHAFLDDFSGPRPGVEDWQRYGALQLRRVSLGVESGDASVRAVCGKTWKDEDLFATVADLKSAGRGVTVVALVGAGGLEHADRHVAATAALLTALPLGPGDLVALLDANEVRDPALAGPGYTPLSGMAWSDQQAALKQGLSSLRARGGAKVVAYSLEKQRL